MVVVDKFGRRWLLMVGISLMAVALTGMTFAFAGYSPSGDDDDGGGGGDDGGEGLTPRTAAIVAGMFLYIGGYQISFGPIAWLLISEVGPHPPPAPPPHQHHSAGHPSLALDRLGPFHARAPRALGGGQVFATDVRDSAIAVAVQANFFWNLVVSFGYPLLVQLLGRGLGEENQYSAAFGVFTVLIYFSLVFVYRCGAPRAA